ncbi:hypothetical protein [Actinomadura sp. WMMB 499]|nr:hypothetical protein [Actinomadura sp. WMMB 499]
MSEACAGIGGCPYGVEAVFRDDSGCWYSLTQPFDQLDDTASWNDCVT